MNVECRGTGEGEYIYGVLQKLIDHDSTSVVLTGVHIKCLPKLFIFHQHQYYLLLFLDL